METHSKRH